LLALASAHRDEAGLDNVHFAEGDGCTYRKHDAFDAS
jgi:hypothetical protein